VLLYTVEKACRNIGELNKPFIIIKHDVERNPEKALKISKIEHSFGIKATYYVHSFFLRNPKNVAILKEIISLGHEVGYHYDVLDSNNGDKNNAIKEFRESLSLFAENEFTIKTTCPHGNPLKKRVGYSSNKDFFLDNEIRKLFNHLVDVTDAKYAYFYRDAKTTKTDATEKLLPLDGTDDIIKMIQDGQSMIISIHTHRYFSFGYVASARISIYKITKFTAKALYKTRCGKYIINKFYFIAKKI
jgi:hypothetical protein